MLQWFERIAARMMGWWLPPYLTRQVVFELKAKAHGRLFGARRSDYRGKKGLLVNIGCGAMGRPGWVNVDLLRGTVVNCVWDCRRSLPFEDGSVAGIFSEHFLEHLDVVEELPRFLKECHRVMAPGAVMRLVVPDLERFLRAYGRDSWEELTAIRPLDEGHVDHWTGERYETPMQLINEVFRQSYEHKYAHDMATLTHFLHRAGFDQIEPQEQGQSLLPELLLDQPIRASESLYVEVVR